MATRLRRNPHHCDEVIWPLHEPVRYLVKTDHTCTTCGRKRYGGLKLWYVTRIVQITLERKTLMIIDTGGIARTNLDNTTVCDASKLIEKHLHRYIRLQISNPYPTEAQWSHLKTTTTRVMEEVAPEQQHDIHPLAVCYVCDVHICHPDRHYIKPDLGKQHCLFKPRLSLFKNYVINRTHSGVKVTDGWGCFSQSPSSW